MKNIFSVFIFSLCLYGIIQAQILPKTFYEVRNFKSKLAISNQDSMNNAATLVQLKSVGEDGHWEFITQGDLYLIRNKASGQYIANFKRKEHAAVMRQTDKPGKGALWSIIPVKEGFYQFKNELSHLYLANRQRMNEGASIFQVENPVEGSYWKLVAVPKEREIVGKKIYFNAPKDKSISQSKMDALLSEIGEAESMDQVRRAIVKAKITDEDDLKILQEKLESSNHTKKLEQLLEKEYKGRETDSNKAFEVHLKKHQEELDRSYNQKLEIRNDKALKLAQKFTANNTAKSRLKTLRPQPTMDVDISPMGEPTDARIERVSPEVLMPETSARIYGNEFGTSRGQVVIVLEDRMYPCEILEWRDDFIEAEIPIEVMAILMGEEKEVRIWVKMPEGEIGPDESVRLAPNYGYLSPRIEAVSSNSISPDQLITITGENFINSNGEDWMPNEVENIVLLDLSGLCLFDECSLPHTIRVNSLSSITSSDIITNNQITSRLPSDITGYKSGPATLIVRNEYGLEDRIPIQFEARRYSFTLEKKIRVHATTSPFSRNYCIDYSRNSVDWGPFGHKEKFKSKRSDWFNYFDVANIDDTWYAPEHFSILGIYVNDIRTIGSAGFELDENTEVNEDYISYELDIWADFFSRISISLVIHLEGPYCLCDACTGKHWIRDFDHRFWDCGAYRGNYLHGWCGW